MPAVLMQCHDPLHQPRTPTRALHEEGLVSEVAPATARQAPPNLPSRSVSRWKHRRPDSKVAALVRNGVLVIGRAEHLRGGQLARLLPGVAACVFKQKSKASSIGRR
jgi:hypothetical protein